MTLPAIRTGVMLGVVESSIQEAVDEMVQGVRGFINNNPATTIQNITVVVYRDPNIIQLLENAIKS